MPQDVHLTRGLITPAPSDGPALQPLAIDPHPGQKTAEARSQVRNRVHALGPASHILAGGMKRSVRRQRKGELQAGIDVEELVSGGLESFLPASDTVIGISRVRG